MSAPNATFRDIEGYFKKMGDQEGASENFYTFLHVISQILLGVKNDDLDMTKITTPNGQLAFTNEEAAKANALIDNVKPIISGVFSSTQKGGGPNEIADQLLELAGSAVDPEQISVDNVYFKMTDYFDKLDDQNRSIARQIGPVAFTSELKVDPFVPNPLQAIGIPPPKFQIPARSILPITNAILELFRVMVTLSPIQFPFIRNMLTITIATFDVVRGEWKYGLFSLLGLFGNKPLLFGIFLKIVRDAWLLVEPGLAKQLRTNVFKASKSMFVGFWLWSFATFAPDFIRGPLEAGIGPFRQLVDTLNSQIATFQEQANVAAEPLGIKVTFPTVPTDIVPSFADIQNLQTIVQQPEVYCSAPVRALLEPVKALPPLRFVLEMLNIPMVPELQAEACRGIDPNNLSGELAARLRPQIDILPGGAAEKAMQAAATVQTAADNAASFIANPIPSLTNALDTTKSLNIQEPVNEPVNKSVNTPVNEPVNESVNTPVNEPVNESVNTPVNTPVNEPVKKATTKGGKRKTLRYVGNSKRRSRRIIS